MGGAHLLCLLPGGVGVLYLGTCLAGFAYGMMWALGPTVIKEIFGVRFFASNYSMMPAAPTLGSLVYSTVLASRFYEAAETAGSGNCFGPACYRPTHAIIAVANLASVLLFGELYRCTAAVYGGRAGDGESSVNKPLRDESAATPLFCGE